MKAKVIAVTVALTVTLIAPVYADVYVAVDENGNAVSGAIMCDAITCGANSDYSRVTLQAGQRYVLQSNGYAGIGNNNPDTKVSVNTNTNVWTIENPVSVTQYNGTLENPIVQRVINNVIETSTALVDTSTVTIESATVTSTTNTADVLSVIQSLLTKIFSLLALLGIKG